MISKTSSIRNQAGLAHKQGKHQAFCKTQERKRWGCYWVLFVYLCTYLGIYLSMVLLYEYVGVCGGYFSFPAKINPSHITSYIIVKLLHKFGG
jgi:hypothetical protein